MVTPLGSVISPGQGVAVMAAVIEGIRLAVLLGTCVKLAVGLRLGVADGNKMEGGLEKICTGDGVADSVFVAVGAETLENTCGKTPISAARMVPIKPVMATMYSGLSLRNCIVVSFFFSSCNTAMFSGSDNFSTAEAWQRKTFSARCYSGIMMSPVRM